MKTSQQMVQLKGDLPPCQKPPESQDIFDWNNFVDYSVGSSSLGYFSNEYQERGSTGSELSLHLNQGQVSSQGMTPISSRSSQIVMNEDLQNTDKQESNRNEIFFIKLSFSVLLILNFFFIT